MPHGIAFKHQRHQRKLLASCAVIAALITGFTWLSSAFLRPTRLPLRRSTRSCTTGGEADESSNLAGTPNAGVVAVAGATGRAGKLVVEELERRGEFSEVVALVRNSTKAAEVLQGHGNRVRLVMWNSSDEASSVAALEGVDAVVWCAEGQDGITNLGNILAKIGDREGGQPRVVMCSSAAVTRPTWSQAKAGQLEGAADIPIVRLNPGNILGGKRSAEELLRSSGAAYAIVRPTGLNDKWPAGRPILSQGDLAVGRISRSDLASLLVDVLDEPQATGKTFEAVSVAGYPKPSDGYSTPLSRLHRDGSQGLIARLKNMVRKLSRGGQASQADAATYHLLQQLLPGESQDSAGLAMGQTYEQYDKKRRRPSRSSWSGKGTSINHQLSLYHGGATSWMQAMKAALWP